MKTLIKIVLCACFVSVHVLTAQAQTSYTWTGTTSTAWGTSTNWSPIGVPSSTDYIIIQTGANDLVLTTDQTIERYRINSGTMDLNGYTLTVNDQLLMYGGVTEAGRIIQSATNTAYISNATVNCKLDLTATTVTIQYSDMADSVRVHQTTTSGTITWRGNRFYGHLEIENTSNGNMNLGYNPADSCFAGLTIRGRRVRAGYAYPGYYVEGNVMIEDEGPSGTSIGLAGGNGTASITVDGDVVVDKSGDGNLMFAVTSGTCQMIQTEGHSIYDGSSGYTNGYHEIMGLTQGTGGGVSYTEGAGTQEFVLDVGTHGPNIGSLNIDLDDVTIDGAVVNGYSSVIAEHLSILDNQFRSAAYLEKTGSGANNSGGNVFRGPATIVQSGSADMQFAYTAPDTAYSTLQLRTTTSNDLILGAYDEFVAMGSIYCDQQSGDIILGGTSGGDFVVAGPGVQTLALEQGNEVSASKVSVNKPSGHARLTGTMRVTGSLIFTNGVIQTVDTGLVVVADNATVTGASDNSHVEGPVSKEGNEAFTFPIGRNGIYQPLTISAPSTTAHTFRAEYFDEDSDPLHTHTSRDGSITYLDRTQYWTYQRTAGTNNLYVTLGWRNVSCGIASINDPDVCAWNGTQWKNLGNSVPTGTTTTGTARTSKTTAIYGAYTWGNFSGIHANAGPDRVMEAGDTVSIGVMTQENWDYDWTPSGTVEQADTAITRAYPTTKTEYVLEVTGENSCTAKDTMTVFITVMPEDTARSSLDFVVNNGQIIDTDGAPREDIGIYSHQASPMLYCGDNRLSFVHAKIDTVAATPDTLARVDIHFHQTFREAEPLGMGLNSHHYNYYYAHCPDGVTLTPSYNRVVYPLLYENTDLHIKGNNAWMKFEFVIHPGGDPEDILMTFEGAENVELIEQLGLLIVTSNIGTYVFPQPSAWKSDTIGDVVELGWQPDWDLSVEGDTVRFTNIGSYDPEEVLIFTLGETTVADVQHISNPEWSTHYGGDGYDEGTGLSVDTDGNVYNCGFTDSQDFPSDFGANTGNFGGFDAYIARFGSATGASLGVVENGDRLQWSTYWGGSGDDKAFACTSIGSGTDGKTYITGTTASSDLPLSNSGSYIQPNVNGTSDALLIAIDNLNGGTDQGYRWTTAFGGGGVDEGRAITTDASGNIYIAGSTSSPSYTANTCAVPTDGGFPKCNTSSTYSNIGSYGGGSTDGFIARFNPSGTLQWSTFYGGSDMDVINDLVFDGEGNLYITGETGSVSDFPTLSMSTYDQPFGGGETDAFVARFDDDLVHEFCSFYGGDGDDAGNALGVDQSDNVFIGGWTSSDNDETETTTCEAPTDGSFPLCANGYFQEIDDVGAYGGGSSDGFIFKLSNTYPVWATYFGGAGDDEVTDVAVDYRGYLFATGNTSTPSGENLVQYSALGGEFWYNQATRQGTHDGFIALFDDAHERIWSSFHGYNTFETSNAIALNATDAESNYFWYVTGYSNSSNFLEYGSTATGQGGYTYCCPNTYLQPSTSDAGNAYLVRMSLIGHYMLTGMEDRTVAGLDFIIYPNPTTSEFFVEGDLVLSSDLSFEVYSITGSRLFNTKLNKAIGPIRQKIDLRSYSNGLYLLVIRVDGQTIGRRIIKTH